MYVGSEQVVRDHMAKDHTDDEGIDNTGWDLKDYPEDSIVGIVTEVYDVPDLCWSYMTFDNRKHYYIEELELLEVCMNCGHVLGKHDMNTHRIDLEPCKVDGCDCHTFKFKLDEDGYVIYDLRDNPLGITELPPKLKEGKI